MNVINTTVLRNNLADAIAEIQKKKDYLLIAKRGKISSALISIDFLEDLLEKSDSKYLASIKKAREEYKKGEIFTHNEAFGEL
jgi:PHD/YefM family antitoxin component YafN of YafNO toxin-antitoxin module